MTLVSFLHISQSTAAGIRHQIQWCLFNITTNVNLVVTIIYWSVLYSPSLDFSLFYDFNLHATPAILTTLDLCVTAVPVRLLHFVYPLGFGIAYVTMTLIFWAVGGRTPYGPIYPILDYENKPGLAAGVICGTAALVVVLQGVLWAVYKLRIRVWGRCRPDGDTRENLNVMEEAF